MTYIKLLIVSSVVLLLTIACGLSTPQVVTNEIKCFKGEIVLSSDMDGSNEIYVMQPYCGASFTRLTNDSAEDKEPRWSPDGNKIAFVSDRSGKYQIFVMDKDGSNVKQVTDIKDKIDFIFSPTCHLMAIR